MEPVLKIQDITKSFNGKRALDNASFDVYPGEIVALLGPSGCGKSTLLMMIAGLLPSDSGEIRWKGQSLRPLAPHERGFGLMFQDYALFPHMNAAANIAFGLRYQEMTSEEREKQVSRLLKLVHLEGFDQRDITSLSGGEQQRIALARSLAPGPRLLMLDEPLGALDAALRERLLSDLQQILKTLGQTAIYVTHDQSEAFAIADRVVVMQSGQIEQIGTPQEIYLHPVSRFVAEFLGFDNFVEGTIESKSGRQILSTPFGSLPWKDTGLEGQVNVLLRPEGASLKPFRQGLSFSGVVRKKSFRGTEHRVRVETDEGTFRFNFSHADSLPESGSEIHLFVDSASIQVFGK